MKTLIDLTKFVAATPRWLVGLALTGLMAACSAPALKAVQIPGKQYQAVLIVPVTAPPLEVIPDLLEQHDAAYRHVRNMAMNLDLEKQRYRTAGGIVVVGMVAGNPSDAETLGALPPTAVGGEAGASVWTPAKTVGEQLKKLLAFENRVAVLSREDYPLVITNDASLHDWHRAIQAWYRQDNSTGAYANRGRYDAVIELGVGRYRIFEGQTSLQLMLKLIDPASGHVLARTHSESFRVDDAALASLEQDGVAFRQLIGNMAAPLLRQSLGDLGLRDLPVADES
ncbi:hypothetical protein [Methylomonas koyamae]|uniref:hypothetical protein n=1 Tax=Methylomonas koyamae TaxID=702114 RepID=UPI001C339496|nr:hypothetical protein [Methylomonas koyamae]BBL57741.1 hypothetical protein MKFW12EY_13540 [Methylomonas koyamae]